MQPQYPTYPQGMPAPVPAHYPQQYQYPGQIQYPPQYAPQQPAYAGPPPVNGSLDDFFNQPSTGEGAGWKFHQKPIGTTYSGIVARSIGQADIRQQTDNSGRPMTFRDGRPKFVMVVPMLMQPTAEHPEGRATWWVKGQARDELVRAMAEVGAPEGPPEAGAAVTVTLVGMRQIPGMNPAHQYRITYVRPQGAQPGQPVPQHVQQAVVNDLHAMATTPYVQPAQMAAQPPIAPTVPATQMYQQPVNAAPAPVQQAQQPVPAAPVAPVASTLTPEQQALLAQLTGQQPAA